MKYLLLGLIAIYNRLMSPVLKTILGVDRFCRFNPTCSHYARLSIAKYGSLRGTWVFLKRFIKCQPFYPGN